MLKAVREQKGDTLIVRLSGTVDESSQLETLFGQVPPKLIVHCKDVHQLNSAGVKSWIRFFSDLKLAKVNFQFIECSPPVVEQINMIMNFTAGGSVASIYLPFYCAKCSKSFYSLISIDKLRTIYKNLPAPACPQCGSATEFDDIEDEYFGFLERA
jgi:anti-anti-sigma regulatory factor/DNA-directed RNA polymerase subunit RPC12/RpoP